MGLSIDKALQLHQAGKFREAARLYNNILKRNPRHADALHLLGVIHLQTKDYPSGEKLIKKALALSPGNAEAYNNLGTILHEQGKLDGAMECYHKAISLKPDFAMAYSNLGKVFKDQGKLEQAVKSYSKAISLEPDFAMAYNNLGTVLRKQGKPDEAIKKYHKAISLRPDFAGAYSNLGKALQEQGNLDEAIECYHKAISLEPDFAMAYYNLGNALQEQGRLNEAIEKYTEAISLQPDLAKAHSNIGTVLQEQNRLDEAIEKYRKAIFLEPDYARAHFNLSCALLLKGCFEEGWEEYEWRLRVSSYKALRFNRPLWTGEAHKNGTILIYTEQGFGDSIQCVRYLPMVKQRVGQVILACRDSLKGIFGSLHEVDKLIDINDVDPVNNAFDCYLSLMSLPGIFRTRIDTIPSSVPYIFSDHKLVEKSKSLFDGYSERYKTGIVWRGSPKPNPKRSCEFEDLVSLLSIPDIQLFSLQKEEGIIPQMYREKIVDLGPSLHTFADTAAIIDQLDLIISIDTAIAHLAGAMGKPVWTLIPFAPDWRWMLNREDSPWYPTMKLFRQSEMGNWGDVFERVREELVIFLGRKTLN